MGTHFGGVGMRLLYGTKNHAKLVEGIRELSPLGIEIIGLPDCAPDVSESGNTPLENAREKALAYYNAFECAVFAQDSGLYIENLPDELQPGVHVRRPRGRYLDDAEMVEYYSALAGHNGDLRARWHDGICLVVDREHIFDFTYQGRPFIITAEPHEPLTVGYPLDCLSLAMKDYAAAPTSEWDELREFVKKNLGL